MSGYFKVSLAAAAALQADCSPELLSAYIVLCEAAYGERRELTMAGANAIATYTGCSCHRGKKLLNELLSLRFGRHGELGFAEPTGECRKNARVYRLPVWSGEYSYLPSSFVKHKPALLKTFPAYHPDPNVIRDALFLLVHLYASVDYGELLGQRAEEFFHQVWETRGEHETDAFCAELGRAVCVGEYELWAVRCPLTNSWQVPLMTTLQHLNSDLPRLSRALDLLLRTGSVFKLAIVSFQNVTYPLWAFGKASRDWLAAQGFCGSLAKDIDRLARLHGADPNNEIIAAAARTDATEGTGLYFCLSKGQPTVKTLLLPRWMAPTIRNAEGLKECAKVSQRWSLLTGNLSRAAA